MHGLLLVRADQEETELQTTGEDEGEESIKDQFYASEEIKDQEETELQTTGEDEGEDSIKDQFYALEEIRLKLWKREGKEGAYREFLDATDFALVGGDINVTVHFAASSVGMRQTSSEDKSQQHYKIVRSQRQTTLQTRIKDPAESTPRSNNNLSK
ncbi:hypothetical protein Bca101_051325 [Brassica carinata]